MPQPSIDELRANFRYEPETGRFYRKTDHVAGNGAVCARAGDEVRAGNGSYRRLHIGKLKVYAHRAAWAMVYGEWPKYVDHINGDKLDNRLANLRACSMRQNSGNSRLSSTNKSGYKGVCWHRAMKKWHAQIKGRGSLGFFDTPQEAHEAYKAAAVQVFGEFARFE